MRKLLKMFKSLPREVRMMIAMAGLGSPFGIFYLLNQVFFPGKPVRYIIFAMIGVMLVIGAIGFILTKIFKRGGKKRSKKMAADLAADSEGGRVSMDVGAAIKANNEKFFTAIKDMRKNIGISVYDLPWYIVMGDSGCGKTKLINEGGLQFSTGKPEGYQLGTLNYNWWFTEDAVFVDMAGRLCNPRDDADRREWEAFLNTVAKGRKGFPINGAIVCVSADHLLQDPPEKIEQDANTTLERLRDVQTKLGVTFATYLVITKCDKIVGFMQFFDRAERDITVLNQMFGWSKTGDFSELYDPEGFPNDFDDVYRRLYELRLRRLNDEAEENDLGLAYSFPEEFRELTDPLQTYIRTLFPKIKNPRAIKNLLYRGLFFTSATREGGLILKHLTERLGAEAASQFAPLDLYPSKRPYFIKDLLFRKIFPEHGLVFRNEQQAVRNRKVARLMKWGSVSLAVLLFGLLGLSTWRFKTVIGQPRTAATNADATAAPPIQPQALALAKELETGIGTLEENFHWAQILSLFVGADRPIQDLKTIQAALFERVLLREAFVDISGALASGGLADPGLGQPAQDAGLAYMAAFKEYLKWYGCVDGTTAREHLGMEGFMTMCKIVANPESPINKYGDVFSLQAARYFGIVEGFDDWPSPARVLDNDKIDARQTISSSLFHLHAHLGGYATLSDRHPDPDIQQWMRIQTACSTIKGTYERILSYADDLPDTLEDLKAFQAEFSGGYQAFAAAVAELEWRSPNTSLAVRIPDLRTAILRQRDWWIAYQASLEEAYAVCQLPNDPATVAAIGALSGGSTELQIRGVDRLLWDSLKQIRLTDRDFDPLFFEPEGFKRAVTELTTPYSHVFTLDPGQETTNDSILATPDVITVRDTLSKIQGNLASAKFDPPEDPGTPEQWVEKLSEEPPEDDEVGLVLAKLAPTWRPDDLAYLYDSHQDVIMRGQGRLLLLTMNGALEKVGEWGLAELVPHHADKVPSVFRIALPRAERPAEAKADVEQKSDEGKRRKPRRERRQRPRRDRSERGSAPARERVVRQGAGQIPTCATRSFLFDAAYDCSSLLFYLKGFDSNFHLASDEDNRPLNIVCENNVEDAGEKFMRAYVRAWSDGYSRMELTELRRLIERADRWSSLATRMQRRGDDGSAGRDDVAEEMHAALSGILAALPYWNWSYDEENGEWYSEHEAGDSDWQDVESWMNRAIDSEWDSSLGQFQNDARLPIAELRTKRDDPPWEALATEFGARWAELASAIGANARLPRKFDTAPSTRDLRRQHMPWGRIEQLRREARLENEKLTGELVRFEEKAQSLLSEELTTILAEIQARYFSREEPREGWPYLPSPDGENGLETVDFTEFKRFIREVGYAKTAFKQLEEGISSDDPLLKKRLAFYRECKAWKEFLHLTDKLGTDPLRVEVDRRDPMREASGNVPVDDTPQHYYAFVELELGLEVERDGRYGEAALKVYTKADKQAENKTPPAQWSWKTPSDQLGLTVRFGGGMTPKEGKKPYPNLELRLGDGAPLAFCAYLQRHGKGSATEWLTTHSMHLPDRIRDKGQRDYARQVEETGKKYHGLSFAFTLNRPLPGPIVKLEKADRGSDREEESAGD